MRLLAVSFFLPPDLFPQPIQIGRLLSHSSATVGALCGESSQTAPAALADEFDRQLAFRETVAFRPMLSGLAKTLARRFAPFYGRIPDEHRRWIPLAEKSVLSKLQESGFQPDVMVTFGEPMSDHLVGLRLKSRLGVPWIAHFSDPWVDNPFRRHEFLACFVNARLESRVIAVADRLIFTSEETRDLVMRKYPEQWRAKTEVLPHSFDPALYPQPTKASGPLTVRYLGNFYGHRSPVPLFRALKFLLTHEPKLLDDVQFELVGSMPSRMRMHASLRSLPAGLVRLRDTVPYQESLNLMSSSDLLLVIDGPDDLSVFLPSKLIDYLGARVPVLGIVPPGTSAKLLARLGAPVANPRDPEQVASTLRRALALASDRRRAANWQPWGNPTVASEYEVKNVAAAFRQIVQDTLQRNRVSAQ
ncbi:MAG: glycosyltransferase [Pseudolabrys sp.]